jgi:hypothetical protein
MKEVKSKKTGKIDILSDDEYKDLIKAGLEKRFIVTDIRPVRNIISSIKEPEKKITKSKNE